MEVRTTGLVGYQETQSERETHHQASHSGEGSKFGLVSSQDGDVMMDGPTCPTDFPNLDEPDDAQEAGTDKAGTAA